MCLLGTEALRGLVHGCLPENLFQCRGLASTTFWLVLFFHQIPLFASGQYSIALVRGYQLYTHLMNLMGPVQIVSPFRLQMLCRSWRTIDSPHEAIIDIFNEAIDLPALLTNTGSCDSNLFQPRGFDYNLWSIGTSIHKTKAIDSLRISPKAILF
jgi:hypothetical protein